MTFRLSKLRRVVVLVVAFIAGLFICDRWMATRSVADVSATAATSRPAPKRPTLSPEVKAIVDRLATTYAKGPIHVEADIASAFDVAGMKENKSIQIIATARSAEAYRHEAKGQLMIDADGSKVHLFDIKRNQYADAPLVGEEIGADMVRDDARAILLQQNPALFIALGNEAIDAISFEGDDVALLEPASADGRVFDRLESIHGDASRQVWIDRERGTIDHVVYDFTKMIANQGATDVRQASVTIRYTKTELGIAAPSDEAFAFSPPADATPMRMAGNVGMAAGDPTTLEGKPAPAFELKDLDGNLVKFPAGGNGKVVVLDFWATWCPPCRESLPHVAAASAKFADQGVSVYAVNQGEERETVKNFLTAQNLQLTALLDSDGEMSMRYLVSTIPQTVVIGADGVVRKVAVGIDPSDTTALDIAIEAARK